MMELLVLLKMASLLPLLLLLLLIIMLLLLPLIIVLLLLRRTIKPSLVAGFHGLVEEKPVVLPFSLRVRLQQRPDP